MIPDAATPPEPGPGEPRAARAWAGPCAWLSLLAPLAAGIWSLSGESSWRDDPALARDLVLAPVGLEGAVSSLLTQLLVPLPLGGLVLRASLVGVLALALSSRLFFGALDELLERRFPSALNPLLACFACALWSLSPQLLALAGRVGGPLPAVALVLLALRIADAGIELSDRRCCAAAGIAAGAACAESHAAGVLLGLWLALRFASPSGRRALPELGPLLLAAAGARVLLGSLRWPLPGGVALPELAAEPGARGASLLLSAEGALARAAADLGTIPLLLAAAGLCVAACSAELRRGAAAWALFAAAGAFVDLWPAPGEQAAPLLLSVLASLGVLAFVPIALLAAVRALWASPLPYARPAAVLSVSFAATLVLARADRATQLPAPELGAAAWTEEALGRLPARSLLLVHSPRLAFRALVSRILHDTRPDVVVVSGALLSADALAQDTALSDRALSPVLRQLWVNGVADEYGLSRVADTRPVLAELDPRWDRRTLEHLRPDGVWLGFSAQPQGVPDRRAGVEHARAALRRALALGGGPDALDAATRRVLGTAAADQALLLAALGERAGAGRLAHAARWLDRNNPRLRQLLDGSEEPAHGRVANSDRSR